MFSPIHDQEYPCLWTRSPTLEPSEPVWERNPLQAMSVLCSRAAA